MQYDQFIGDVQNRAQLPTREDALRVTRITLETLGDRLDEGTAENLGAQLPDEIGRFLTGGDDAETFEWTAFVDRVVEAGDYSPEDERGDAVHHARSVIDVVDDAVVGSALADARDQLPESDDWDDLFAFADQETDPVDKEQR